MDSLELLKKSLSEGPPTLFVGAGFSYGAENGIGANIPMATDLTKSLVEKFYLINPPEKDASYIQRVTSSENSLKTICQLIKGEGRQQQRDQFLTDTYKGCRATTDSGQNMLSSYPWKRIFSTNIDDLIENIYIEQGQSLHVWNFSDKGTTKFADNAPLLIKLHGDVNDPHGGYVFDEDEYSEFLSDDNCLLNEFGDAYTDGDIIFIGTEFQEDDMRSILNRFKNLGYKTNGLDYFFVTPSINSLSFHNEIDNTPNYHWIKIGTYEFLKDVLSTIMVDRSHKRGLEQNGAIFLNESFGSIPATYVSDLYNGNEPIVDDFLTDWDFRHPKTISLIEDVLKTDGHHNIAIHGRTYVGKTCAALRLLTDLLRNGFISIQLLKCSQSIVQRLQKYLQKYPEGTKLAVMFEDASDYYSAIVKMMGSINTDKIRLVAIFVDSEVNFASKSYVLLNSEIALTDWNYDQKVDSAYASVIYDKLVNKDRLGRYNDFLGTPPDVTSTQSKKKVTKEMERLGDIIDVIYFAENGEGFRDHFKGLISGYEEDANFNYLVSMSVLEVLGINRIPLRVFSALNSQRVKLDTDTYIEQYSDIITVSGGQIKFRGLRVVEDYLLKQISSKQMSELIERVVHSILGQFKEKEVNEYSIIFQRILKTNSLLKFKLLNVDEIYQLLLSLQSKYPKIKMLSFYWIQIGIATRIKQEYGEAYSYLRNAKRISPNSYHVLHALAKNFLERGLYLIEKGDVEEGKKAFAEGLQDLKTLTNDRFYSGSHRYSLHTYIDMSIKYYRATKEELSEDEFEFMLQHMLEQRKVDLDVKILAEIKNLRAFCKSRGYTSFARSLYPIITSNARYIAADSFDLEIWD